MSTLKEASIKYEPMTARNITELEVFDIDTELYESQGVNSDGEEYELNYIVVNNERYRVPNSVMAGIKALLSKIPHLKTVTVLKTGEGKSTRYQVIPYNRL